MGERAEFSQDKKKRKRKRKRKPRNTRSSEKYGEERHGLQKLPI
jgi:hypothetical protein